MKKTIIYLVAAIIAIPALNSCKKGEEDPLSLNSRDSRITGTWTLTSEDVTTKTTTVTVTTNTVNGDESKSTDVNTVNTTVAGGTKTVTTTDDDESASTFKTYDGALSAHKSDNSSSTSDVVDTDTYTYEVSVSVYKDNTYSATITKGAVTNKNVSSSSTDGGASTGSNVTTKDGTGTTRTWTEEGTWSWADGKKDKIIIAAGRLKGYLLRLAKDEIMISETEDTNDSDIDVTTDVSTLTYSNTVPTDRKDADETVNKTVTKVMTRAQTWTKSDKESDNPDAAE